MKTVAEYESRANQAAQLAAKARTDEERSALEEIARLWLKLADDRRAELGAQPAEG